MKCLCFLCCLIVAVPASATVFKRIESDGSVVFTDKPGANSEAIELSNSAQNVIPSSPQLNNFTSNPSSRNQSVSSSESVEISFITPLDRDTIRNNGGFMQVYGRVTPARTGLFELILNGKKKATNNEPIFTLEKMPRGEYSIQIRLKDKTGKLIASSQKITIYLHRASILSRPR